MEKIAINFSLRAFITKFRHVHGDSLDPNMLWRAILWAELTGVVLVAIFAYLTYDWAISIETPSAPAHSSRDSFSLSELEDVIALYRQKEANFGSLLSTAPQAPNYQRVKAVGAISTSTPELNGPTGAITTPVPAKTR